MHIVIDTDAEQLKKVGEQIKQNPNAMKELESDPHRFLKQMGISVDKDTAAAIQERLRGGKKSSRPKPAGLVHIDI